MTKLSLGQLLAHKTAEDTRKDKATQAARDLAVQAKSLARYQKVAAFFERAKSHFTKKITAGASEDKLGIILGSPVGRHASNMEVYRILDLDSGRVSITESSHAMHRLWAEFSQWCRSQGLEPKWRYEWDGGGMSSWYVLTVYSAAEVTEDAEAFVNPNDVLLQHNYCLHVLYSTAWGLLKAGDALYALQGNPVAAAAVTKLEPLLKSTRELVAKLDA